MIRMGEEVLPWSASASHSQPIGRLDVDLFELTALDALDAAIPSRGLRRIGGPLPQLLDDVGGWLDPGGGESLRRAGREKLIGNLALASSVAARRLHLPGLASP